MMRFTALLFCLARLGWAQIPAFDAVSIRPCAPGTRYGNLDFSHGHIILNCVPLKTMIAIAYGHYTGGRWNGIPLDHVQGGPSWTDPDPANSNNYRVIARSNRNLSEELTRGPMLRAILADRFKLRILRETRQVPAFALTVEPHGSKLRSFDGTCTLQDVPQDQAPKPPFSKPLCRNSLTRAGNHRIVNMPGTTIPTFVNLAGRFARAGTDLDGPIVDRTGLSGFFDIHVEFGATTPLPGDDVQTLPGIAQAFSEQLGLRLQRTVGPDEFLVIEHVERPSAN
ncbi:MAG TPA: TIGR03435 family protein [Bryobacteraceae bacterium]|nr:TIGR03435 family protein [Bryobacteraceae bacterium]